jgi:hypothetical protein
MNKSIIVTGVPGGKTRFAERIAKHLGLHRINIQWNGTSIFLRGHLYITDSKNVGAFAPHVLTFAEVAKQINEAIPLTEWFPYGTEPVRKGEYNATYDENKEAIRWWDGKQWSAAYFRYETDGEKRRCKSTPLCLPIEITWRGLSEEPIIVSEAA